MAESGSIRGKGRIRASVEKLSRGVPEKDRICVSTENRRILASIGKRYNPCGYREIVPASTGKMSNLCEYRKMASYGSVPGKGRIRASVEKAFWRVPEKGRTCVSNEKWRNRGQYGEKVESVRVSKNFPGEYWKKVEIF